MFVQSLNVSGSVRFGSTGLGFIRNLENVSTPKSQAMHKEAQAMLSLLAKNKIKLVMINLIPSSTQINVEVHDEENLQKATALLESLNYTKRESFGRTFYRKPDAKTGDTDFMIIAQRHIEPV